MSKTPKLTPVDFEKTIMAKVKANEISMKPRWYFVLGSLGMVAGLVGLSIGAVFLTNLTLFLVRQHGPMGQWRLQVLLSSFPIWVPILAIVGIMLGIGMLKKYDFSYRKNFWLIIAGFVVSVILAGVVLNWLGLNETWSKRGSMRRFYLQIEGPNSTVPRDQGQGQGRGRFYHQGQ